MILKSGYESPKFISNIIENYSAEVKKPANVNFNWQSTGSLDSGIWQNVEYVKNKFLIKSFY